MMLARASEAVKEAALQHALFKFADAEHLPICDLAEKHHLGESRPPETGETPPVRAAMLSKLAEK